MATSAVLIKNFLSMRPPAKIIEHGRRSANNTLCNHQRWHLRPAPEEIERYFNYSATRFLTRRALKSIWWTTLDVFPAERGKALTDKFLGDLQKTVHAYLAQYSADLKGAARLGISPRSAQRAERASGQPHTPLLLTARAKIPAKRALRGCHYI